MSGRFKVTGSIDRRDLLKGAATMAGAWALGGTKATAQSTQPASRTTDEVGVTSYAFGLRTWVRVEGRVFTCYRAEATQKYPYFYPVIGPGSGLPLTDETALPWPHHRSLFLGCDRVNGGNYWQASLAEGRIASRGPTVEESGNDRAVIVDHCNWHKPGQPPIMEDARRFTITAPTPHRRIIDADITLTGKVDIHIAKTNHSFFSLRAARELAPLGGGTLVNAEGQTGEQQTFGQVSRWCGYCGTRLGVTESIVLMDHPGNPFPRSPWFTRDYGFISPTPFFWLDERGWRLPAGQSIRVRYRVVASKGKIVADEMNRLHAEWSETAVPR